MTPTPPPPTPLEARDPERARALKAKIRDRVADVRRHLIALRAAMAEFGEDFDLGVFAAARAGDEFVPFYDAYRRWIARGFSATPPA